MVRLLYLCRYIYRRSIFFFAVTFSLFTTFLIIEPPSRWPARVEALFRDHYARKCQRAVPRYEEKSHLPFSSPRLLVCMPVGPFKPSRFAHTERALAELLSYTHFNVTISVDTISQETANVVAKHFSVAISMCKLRVRLWSVDFLVRQWPLATGLLTGEPPAYLLSHAHRLYMHEIAADYDWLAYVEDDMRVPEAAMILAAERMPELWPSGWLPGFLRVENDTLGEAALPDLIANEIHSTTHVYCSPTDPFHLYASVHNGYTAVWLLSREQFSTFYAEVSGVYRTGPLAFDVRARMSWGYYQAHSPTGSWLPRVLLPLAGNGTIDPRSCIFHQPNNYCSPQGTNCPSLEETSKMIADVRPKPLPIHNALPCALDVI